MGHWRSQAECVTTMVTSVKSVLHKHVTRRKGEDDGSFVVDDDVAWFFASPSNTDMGLFDTEAASTSGGGSESEKARVFRDLAKNILPCFPGPHEHLVLAALGALGLPPHGRPFRDVTCSAIVGPCAPSGFSAAVFPGVCLPDCAPFLAREVPCARNHFDEACAAPPHGAGGVFTMVVTAGSSLCKADKDQALAVLGQAWALGLSVLALAGLPYLNTRNFSLRRPEPPVWSGPQSPYSAAVQQ